MISAQGLMPLQSRKKVPNLEMFVVISPLSLKAYTSYSAFRIVGGTLYNASKTQAWKKKEKKNSKNCDRVLRRNCVLMGSCYVIALIVGFSLFSRFCLKFMFLEVFPVVVAQDQTCSVLEIRSDGADSTTAHENVLMNAPLGHKRRLEWSRRFGAFE